MLYDNQGREMLSMFGLTAEQTRILFSIQHLLVQEDIEKSKDSKEMKKIWLDEWASGIEAYFRNIAMDTRNVFLSKMEVVDAIADECEKSSNRSWYYLVILEAVLFRPYIPLNEDSNKNKEYSKLKYKKQNEYIKTLVVRNDIMEIGFVDSFEKTYIKSFKAILGKKFRFGLNIAKAMAAASVDAAAAKIFTGPVAVATFGSNFAALSGEALEGACLAMAGNGAIPAGGTGMARGILSIVGGGALLETAADGTTVGITANLIASASKLSLMQSAKLEVFFKEIVVFLLEDIERAQAIMKEYNNQISNLSNELARLKLEEKSNKKRIKNLKKSIEYMEKAYKDMLEFVSGFESVETEEGGD